MAVKSQATDSAPSMSPTDARMAFLMFKSLGKSATPAVARLWRRFTVAHHRTGWLVTAPKWHGCQQVSRLGKNAGRRMVEKSICRRRRNQRPRSRSFHCFWRHQQRFHIRFKIPARLARALTQLQLLVTNFARYEIFAPRNSPSFDGIARHGDSLCGHFTG